MMEEPEGEVTVEALIEEYKKLPPDQFAMHREAILAVGPLEEPVLTPGEQLQVEIEKHRPEDGDVLVAKVRAEYIDGRMVDQVRESIRRSLDGKVVLGGIWVLGLCDDADAEVEFVSPAELKAGGRCPVCGELGHWKTMALCCPRHGKFLG